MKSSMSDRNISFYVVDIFIAIDKIKRYTFKFESAEELLYAEQSWDASIRELEIIGEATKHLLNEDILPQSYRRIVDFRNQINHAYFGINEKIVWDVIQNKLPEYSDELKRVVKQKHISLQKAIDKIKEEKHINSQVLDLLKLLETL